jgi:hypothetical protein
VQSTGWFRASRAAGFAAIVSLSGPLSVAPRENTVLSFAPNQAGVKARLTGQQCDLVAVAEGGDAFTRVISPTTEFVRPFVADDAAKVLQMLSATHLGGPLVAMTFRCRRSTFVRQTAGTPYQIGCEPTSLRTLPVE